MRYQDWDILLFPEEGDDTKTPLQEFKTCCDVVQDSGFEIFPSNNSPVQYGTVGRPLPTVSCYVPSLPQGFPFRVSLHCWHAPEPSRATMSLESKGIIVAFEAKVLLDGVCVAGLTFERDAAWPQTIDHSTGIADNKSNQLRFPPFHSEMLSQAWVVPGQAIGRIKVIIAEGTCHGVLGISPFEVTRNVVAFSFQHTPLHILEDAGIAWPNAGMFYQALNQSWNPLSPRRTKESDPESHAHSPRRHVRPERSTMSQKTDHKIARAEGDLSPEIVPSQPACKPFHRPNIDHSVPQLHLSPVDPFIGESNHRIDFNAAPSEVSSLKDIIMVDRSSKSHTSSSDHDQAMPDYARTISPVSSYRSQPMPNYFQPLSSPTMFGAYGISMSESSQSQSRNSNGQRLLETRCLDHKPPLPSSASPSLRSLSYDDDAIRQTDVGPDPIDYLGQQMSQFNELMDATSPKNRYTSGVCGPPNTRLSSAANTPPPPKMLKISAAAEARALSYSGQNRTAVASYHDLSNGRVSSQTGQGPSQPDILLKTNICQDPRNADNRHVSNEDDTTSKAGPLRSTPALDVKGKKEGKASESNAPDSVRIRRKVSIATNDSDKENLNGFGSLQSGGGDNKRRKVEDALPNEQGQSHRHGSAMSKPAQVPDESKTVEGATPNAVASRDPLGHLDNRV